MNEHFKAGFVNIFGAPNAGKSTLLNAILGEKIAIVSPKVQTTRHRILGFLTEDNYQIIFSDTPGIISPKYKLHNKMMSQVSNALEDTDVALLLFDLGEPVEEFIEIIRGLRLKAPAILLLNKIDTVKSQEEIREAERKITEAVKVTKTLAISALQKINTDQIIDMILEFLPENPPFFPEDDISDRPVRFFVSEMIREKIYFLYDKEIPYHTAVVIQAFEDLPHVVKIRADIIVTRETQKMILLGTKGALIKKLGIEARKSIEQFLDKKVFLELFVKVRPKWRDNELYLKEYGY
ncbi:MAG: GTPase Era [Bacteroidetes bacterium 47-18]|nr:MAG: GTPase Era [Bacteroidetes bacterium 47-18]